MKIISIILALMAASALAEPIELTRQQASDLFAAINRIEPGLNSDNVVLAADNLNVLRPVVEALDKGKIRAQRQMDTLPATDDRVAKVWAIRDQIDAKGDEMVKVELARMDISGEEIKTAKVRPADLAPLRLYLRKK